MAPLEAWFEKVYRDEFAFVWRCVRNFGAPERHAEDIVHEVFLVLHRQGSDAVPNVRGFLYLTARNLTRNTQRHEQRVRPTALESGDHPLTHDSPESSFGAQESAQLLHTWLDELPESERDAFVLLVLENVDADSAAEILSCSTSTLYARSQRAREHLARQWHRREHEYPTGARYVVR